VGNDFVWDCCSAQLINETQLEKELGGETNHCCSKISGTLTRTCAARAHNDTHALTGSHS